MGDEKDAFYVVRKGDIIGIYKTFADCQAQAALSPLDPSISIFKGYGLSKEIESYLVSRGLRQAGFSISASDLQDGLFGSLSVCPFQDAGGSSCPTLSPPNKSVKLEDSVEPQACRDPARVAFPASNGRIQKQVDTGLNKSPANFQQHWNEPMKDIKPINMAHPACFPAESSSFLRYPPKSFSKLKDYMEPQQLVTTPAESSSFLRDPPKSVSKLKDYMEPQQLVTTQSCTLEFDGASKGNPGLAGAGAVLRSKDGSQVWLLREGVGIATNNVAEYRSVILGLRTALEKGFKHVTIRGDSLLVCNQIMGKWKTKNENMANLCKDALLLKKQFQSFTIEHVPREFNSAADAQANRAITLRDRQVQVEMTTPHM